MYIEFSLGLRVGTLVQPKSRLLTTMKYEHEPKNRVRDRMKYEHEHRRGALGVPFSTGHAPALQSDLISCSFSFPPWTEA
jgi:hypothetical protein